MERMNEAIENHAQKHKRKKETKCAKEAEAKLIRELLSAQMFAHIIHRI